jgi:hypothetical protein
VRRPQSRHVPTRRMTPPHPRDTFPKAAPQDGSVHPNPKRPRFPQAKLEPPAPSPPKWTHFSRSGASRIYIPFGPTCNVFEELRTLEIEQPCHKGSPRNNLKPTDALRQVRPLLPCFPLVLYSSDLCLVRVPLMRRLTLVIGNKNLLDPIVSGTQPSPESIA